MIGLLSSIVATLIYGKSRAKYDECWGGGVLTALISGNRAQFFSHHFSAEDPKGSVLVAFLIRLIMEIAPSEAGRQLRERREGRVRQRLFQVVKREKEYGARTLGRHGVRGCQQDGEGQYGEEGVSDLLAQCWAEPKDTLTFSICLPHLHSPCQWWFPVLSVQS
jgi:hypothetical protein